MKIVTSILLGFMFLVACNQSPNNHAEVSATAASNGSSQDDADLVAITSVIHDFYAWYDKFQLDTTRNIFFTDDTGKHLKLDATKLEQYFNNIKASGFISDEFFVGEKEMWKKCEAAWKNEPIGDVPSCMDADRFFCAQDWDIATWTSAPVTAEGLSTDKVSATLNMNEGEIKQAQKFELKKENGKWLITKIECDLGVQ